MFLSFSIGPISQPVVLTPLCTWADSGSLCILSCTSPRDLELSSEENNVNTVFEGILGPFWLIFTLISIKAWQMPKYSKTRQVYKICVSMWHLFSVFFFTVSWTFLVWWHKSSFSYRTVFLFVPWLASFLDLLHSDISGITLPSYFDL